MHNEFLTGILYFFDEDTKKVCAFLHQMSIEIPFRSYFKTFINGR
jgi:hypothetical protein